MADVPVDERSERQKIREAAEAYAVDSSERGWMAGQLLRLLNRVERLEAIEEAARDAVRETVWISPNRRAISDEAWDRLRTALEADTGGRDRE